MSLWPSIVALISVVLFRKALGVMIGGICGVILISNGNPGESFTSFSLKFSYCPFQRVECKRAYLYPSAWRVCVFLEKGGGFDSILQIWLKKMETLKTKYNGLPSIGILCFLTNWPVLCSLVGPFARSLIELAYPGQGTYIVDSDSAVAVLLSCPPGSPTNFQ